MAREMLDAANAPGAAKPDLRPGPRGDLARFLEDLDKVTRPL